MRASAARLPRRPRVYFEEWDEPQISGIRWVSELDRHRRRRRCAFPELRARVARQGPHHRGSARSAAARAGDDLRFVVRQEIPAGARGGARRAGRDVPAVRDGQLHEIKSPIILQPGPAALTDGVREIHAALAWCRVGSGIIAYALMPLVQPGTAVTAVSRFKRFEILGAASSR